MKRETKERTYHPTEYDDPEIYFERVRQRKKRLAEEAFRNRKRSGNSKQSRAERDRREAARRDERYEQNQVRSYREEKEYYEKSKRLREYPKRTEAYRDVHKEVPIEQEQPVKPKKKKGKFKKFLIGFAIFILLIVIGAAVIWFTPDLKKKTIKGLIKSPFGPGIVRMFIGSNYEKNVRDKNFNEADVRVNTGAATPRGNISFALIGVDARDEDLTIGTMADSMIVVNVDPKGDIRMGSIYRDTYLLSRNSDGGEVISKANSAYFRNGPVGTMSMMNENFDMAVKDYIVVNFAGLSNIIDILGGITLKVTEEEKDALNYHMYEQNMYAGTEYVPLDTFGDEVHLTGNQATAFCRLRKVTFYSPMDGITYTDDYGRTARQRYVLFELVRQTKDKGILKLLSLMNRLFEANSGERKFIQTSLTIDELTKIMAQGFDMNIAANAAFPDFDHQYTTMLDSGDSMVADTLEENARLFHQFLYDDGGYEPTEDLVIIANKIRDEIARQVE